MNKKDSLAFLDECLNKLNNATKKEIANYKTVYEQNCSNYLNSDSFEFCAPSHDFVIIVSMVVIVMMIALLTNSVARIYCQK